MMHSVLEKFLISYLDINRNSCIDEIKNNEKKYLQNKRYPIFKNHKYSQIREVKEIDYHWLTSIVLEKNKKSKETKKIIENTKLVLVKKITQISRSAQLNITNINNIVERELLNFLTQYMITFETKTVQNSTQKKFLKTFDDYLTNDLFKIYYFSPIHNFDGNFEKLTLNNNLWIRRITEDEFSVVSNLIDGTNTKPDPSITNLTHVIIGRLEKKPRQNNILIIKNHFLDLVNYLKIFKNGDVSLGGFYYFDSENWCVENAKRIEREFHSPSGRLYTINKSESQSFKKLFVEFNKIDFLNKHNQFLQTSVRRFGSAIEQRVFEDKIVDLMISLESLYSAKGTDIQHKMSNRIALLLGSNDLQRIKLFHFIKKSYDFRSRIVHGDATNELIVDSKNYSAETVSEILETITRWSLKTFPKLISKYKQKDLIHTQMDESLLDHKLFSQIRKLSSPLRDSALL